MRRAIHVAILATLIMANVGAEQSEDSSVAFTSLRELQVDREYRLTGYEKEVIQDEIDEAGDDDGRVEPFDIAEWRDWRAAQMTGRTSPDHVLDGHTGTVVGWTAFLTDAQGTFDTTPDNRPDDDDDEVMLMRVVETIAFDVPGDGTYTYYLPSPSRDAAFTFEVPPGHTIVDVQGLTDMVMGQDGRSVRGDGASDRSIRIDFQRAGELVGLPMLADLVGPDAKLGGMSTELVWSDDVRIASYTMTGELSGLDAIALRGLIDDAGNGDGIVTTEEAEDVLGRHLSDRLGTPSSSFIMGGAPATIASAEVVLDGVAGPVGTQNAIGIESTGVLAFDVSDDATEMTLIIAKSARNARLSIDLPDGYSVADDGTEGLRGESFEDGRNEITADEVDGETIQVRIQEGNTIAGFHMGQWVAILLGLIGMLGIIIFLAVTDRRLSKMTRAVHELEAIQRHHVHGPGSHGPRQPGAHPPSQGRPPPGQR